MRDRRGDCTMRTSEVGRRKRGMEGGHRLMYAAGDETFGESMKSINRRFATPTRGVEVKGSNVCAGVVPCSPED